MITTSAIIFVWVMTRGDYEWADLVTSAMSDSYTTNTNASLGAVVNRGLRDADFDYNIGSFKVSSNFQMTPTGIAEPLHDYYEDIDYGESKISYAYAYHLHLKIKIKRY